MVLTVELVCVEVLVVWVTAVVVTGGVVVFIRVEVGTDVVEFVVPHTPATMISAKLHANKYMLSEKQTNKQMFDI